MASLYPRPGGRYQIQLRVGDHRHTIRLGVISRRAAESIKVKVEALALAAELQIELDPELAAWVAKIDEKWYRKLAAAGLTVGRARAGDAAIGDFSAAFIADYTAGGTQTLANIAFCHSQLIDHFGADKPMRTITAAQAVKFREKLLADGYAGPTIGTTVKKARQLWSEALKRHLVRENVWLAVQVDEQTNTKRQFYVSREVADSIIAVCDDPQWRLIVALSRYGGLRCPSEFRLLLRSDVDWAASRFRVWGKGQDKVKAERIVPIFAELRPYLEAVFASPATLGTHVIDAKWREMSSAALRKHFLGFCKAANVERYPRWSHNLRASCQTDLVNAGHPPHVVSRWLGNSESVARKHYLMPTEEDFVKATEPKPKKRRA